MIESKAVWFITGSSKGLGRAIALQALAAGYRVVATARRASDVADIVEAHRDAAMALALDVTDAGAVADAVAAAEARFGSIDVLVNNAGYGYFAAIEEGDDEGVRALFETNVFAPVKLIKAVAPGMRKRGRGHIVNISSVGGVVTMPGVGYYHMTKFALEALSDTLAKELAPFGVGVTVVSPGAFRTDFRGGSSRQSPVRLPAYADTVGKARDSIAAGHGRQRGDPARAAQAILAAVTAERPPVHLALGGDALDLIRQKLTDLRREYDEWETATRSTDFDGGA